MPHSLTIGRKGRSWRVTTAPSGRSLTITIIEPPNNQTRIVVPLAQEESFLEHLKRGFDAARSIQDHNDRTRSDDA